MTARAWIIAVEDYPGAAGLASKHLAGTNQAAVDQYAWLTGTRGLTPADIWVNCGLDEFPGHPPNRRGATADEICASMSELVQAGRGSTDTLFVFFSGHGFTVVDAAGGGGPRQTDVLVSQDFQSLEVSGRQCTSLDALQDDLRWWLGPGTHFYFVDACRNPCRSDQVTPVGCGFSYQRVVGDPALFSLFSTKRGAAAATASGFAGHLVAGLNGTGTAKRWDEDTLGVYFDSLHRYVEARMTSQAIAQRLEPRSDPSGLVHRLAAVPSYPCRVEVEGARATDPFTVMVARRRRQPRIEEFSGSSWSFDAEADQYTIVVSERNVALHSDGNGIVDVFDEVTVVYRRPGMDDLLGDREAAIEVPSEDRVYVSGHPNLDVVLTSRTDPTQTWTVGADEVVVPVGAYVVTASDRRGSGPVVRAEVEVDGLGAMDLLDAVGWPSDPARDELVDLLAVESRGPSWVELAGTIPVLDGDVATWLALAGAAQLLELAPRPGLIPLDRRAAGSSPVVVLAALDVPGGTEIELRVWPDGARAEVAPLGTGSRIGWAVLPATPGPKLLTVTGGAAPTRTVVVHCVAERATLVTLSTRDGRVALGQLSVPMGGDDADLTLDRVRWAAQAQRAFATYRPIAPVDGDDEQWRLLLSGRWIDPVMTVVVGYELLRSGRDLGFLPYLLGNLDRRFPGLADVEYLAAVSAGRPPAAVAHPPIVLEGAKGTGTTSYAGMAVTHLDHVGPWTAWLNAEPSGP